MLRRFKFVVVLSMISVLAFTQDLKITVVNKSAVPIPFAYILVNKKPMAISDTNGIAILSTIKLKENDTISTSYIGASSPTKIYTKTLKESKKIEFVLDETAFMLDDAMVKYFDIKRFYNKNVKSFRPLNYNCQMDANFMASFSAPDKNTRIVSGKIEGANEIRSKEFGYRSKGWFHHPLEIITTDDTSHLNSSLVNQLHFILDNINKAIEFSIPNPPIIDIYKPRYEYLGEKENKKVFRIVYPKTMSSRFPFHILVYIDEKTKEINNIELETVTNSENASLNKFHINYDCIEYKHKNMNPVRFPINIHYTAILSSGITVEIKITDPKIK